jgi:GntR family transcriptional regulator
MWLSIDEQDSRPIYLQLIHQIKEQVLNGTLKPGDELPSVRELADSLSINLHTVRAAYLKLRDQGIINLHLGRRATINSLPQAVKLAELEEDLNSRLEEIITDALIKGIPRENIRKMVDHQLENKKQG